MNKKLSLIGNIGIAAFFLLFPVTGLLWIWNDAHSKIKSSATQYVQSTFPELTKSLITNQENEDISVAFKDSIAKNPHKFVEVNKLTKITPVNSYTKQEGERMAQYVKLQIQGQTANGSANYDVTIRRLTIAPRWRYTEVTLQP